MNKRIKQLAEQVDREFDNPGARHRAIERFAELIVRECAKNFEEYWNSAKLQRLYTPTECVCDHFGVKK